MNENYLYKGFIDEVKGALKGSSASIPAELTFTDGRTDIVNTPESILTLPSVSTDMGGGATLMMVKLADYVDPALLLGKSVVTMVEGGESVDIPVTADNSYDSSAELGLPAGTVWLIAEVLSMVSAPAEIEGMSVTPGLWGMAMLMEVDGVKTVAGYVSKVTNYPGKKKLAQSCIDNGMTIINLWDYDFPVLVENGDAFFTGEGNIGGYGNTFTEKTKALYDLLLTSPTPVYLRAKVKYIDKEAEGIVEGMATFDYRVGTSTDSTGAEIHPISAGATLEYIVSHNIYVVCYRLSVSATVSGTTNGSWMNIVGGAFSSEKLALDG